MPSAGLTHSVLFAAKCTDPSAIVGISGGDVLKALK